MARVGSASLCRGTSSMVALCTAALIAGLSDSSAATFTSFDVPGLSDVGGWNINARGDVAGDGVNEAGREGFVRWADGSFTLLGMDSTNTAINDEGVVVWTSYGRQGTEFGYVRATDGTITEITIPHAHRIAPVAVNAAGVIVGNYDGGSFIRTPDGQIQTFMVPGSGETLAYGMNAGGDVAGIYGYSDGVQHGFLRHADGTFATFDMPNDTGGTWVRGINDRGLVVGDYVDDNGTHGFQRSPNGTLTTINVPNASGLVVATAINNRDMIVGWYGTGSAISGFTLSHGGKAGAIRVPKGHSDGLSPTAININNAITGIYWGADGVDHGFIRSP